MKNLVVLSGAGISAESGLKTFRDADGLWEGHDIMEIASFDGFLKNPTLVLDFYNQRRRQLHEVSPNKAHILLTELETYFNVQIITQNVDDLHERAGSKQVIHLHGELFKARSLNDISLIYDWKDDIVMGTKNNQNHQLRPHIVWFGEAVPEMDNAIKIVQNADILVIIGTSLQVYPAAGLIDYASKAQEIYYIDQNPATASHFNKNIHVIAEKATIGLPILVDKLLKL
ncbi:NAD-dependent deacylase [Flavobacterium sp. xlx-214]|uniref:SIR2 family NAD-dependent protein deacylase n=1 Tax=unclassified Flavobacterium TaxID=196869 RepID=UPI0013D2EF35|nr:MULTISPECIES: NAD-dependent deacylase [unclassified Flavobacterium]MBA5793706.1 NAD-dependent deacylase [Flavobacterium sp. xlx-221]QMI83272.1 NAD-dependent deacylase [Flavobacterium sp. xlx-214]